MEKLIGLLMIAVGAITFYVTYTNIASFGGLGGNATLFLAADIALTVLGIFLLIAKTE